MGDTAGSSREGGPAVVPSPEAVQAAAAETRRDREAEVRGGTGAVPALAGSAS